MNKKTQGLLLFLFIVLTPFLSPAEEIKALGLDWQKEHITNAPPEGYRYYWGDIDWGQLVFVGTRDILSTETELQLFFHDKKIVKAILILGPERLSEFSCFRTYKQVVTLLNKKYGHFKFEKLTRDPLVNDLLHVSECHPLTLGMIKIENVWATNTFKITAQLFGDGGELYIEIEYVLLLFGHLKLQLNPNKFIKVL